MLDITSHEATSEVYLDPIFSKDFLEGLNELRKSEKFFDIIIIVENVQISCHKVVLASASTYFRSMFAGCLKESLLDKVTIYDVEPPILHALIDYCYTGALSINEENVISLLQSADLFQFHRIVEACCNFMIKHLHSANCISIWNYALNMSFKTLANNTLDFTVRCIVDVADRGDILNLSYEQMADILRNPNLFVDKEESAYELLVTWFRVDIELRAKQFCKLLRYIRLPFIRRIYMLSKIETNPYICKSSTCQLLIKETKLFHSCMLNPHDKMSIWLQPRPSTGIGELFISVGGCDDNCDSAGTVRSYNVVTGSWRLLAKLDGDLSGGYSMVSLGNDLYITGGSDGANVFNRVWRYRSQLNEWQELAPMLQSRDYHGSAAINSLIYVVGAEGCECYNFLLDKWSAVSSLCLPVTNCSVTACEGRIYCIGSTIDTNRIVLQMYSPNQDIWQVLPCNFPNDLTFVPQIISLKGIIYFIREDSREVLTFDPESLSWIQTTAQMNMIHLGGNTSIYNNKIVVSGGYNETDNVYKLTGTIEAYDNEKNKWEIVACMPQPVFWHKCSSVYRYVAPPYGQSFVADPDVHNFDLNRK